MKSNNIYIFMDLNKTIKNIVLMPKEPVPYDLYLSTKEQNNSNYCVRVDNGEQASDFVETIIPRGTISIGSTLSDEGAFIEPKPGPEYILDSTNSFWVLPFSMKEFDESGDSVFDHEKNYWE